MPEEKVKVVIRKRPLNTNEKNRGNESIVDIDRSIRQVSIVNSQSKVRKDFAFDSVYDDTSSQRLIYDETAFPLVESVINGTIFAYR